MICPKCGKKNPESGKFCGHCGASLEQTKVCSRCGTEIPQTSRFCYHCGANLDQANVCPECKAECNEGDEFCVRCGTKLVKEPIIQSDIEPETRPRAEPMNLDFLQSELTRAGWLDLRSGQHMDFDFDLVGHRGSLNKWYILVKVLPILDQQTTVVWKTIYNELNKRTKSIWVGKLFILCLIAQDVVEGAQRIVSSDYYGYIRGKGGAGFVLIADINKKTVYGELTSPVWALRKQWDSVREILSNSLKYEQ